MNYSLSMLFMKWLFFYDQPIITEDREVKDIWNAVLIPRQESQSPARTSLDPADNYQYPWPRPVMLFRNGNWAGCMKTVVVLKKI